MLDFMYSVGLVTVDACNGTQTYCFREVYKVICTQNLFPDSNSGCGDESQPRTDLSSILQALDKDLLVEMPAIEYSSTVVYCSLIEISLPVLTQL